MQKNSKGLTLMEITIVLAIMAIIALIVVPIFFTTTDRARLRADIQSARVIQNAIDLHRVERGYHAEGGTNISELIENLSEVGYINARNITVQTDSADWVVDSTVGIMVDISSSPSEIYEAYLSLPADERRYVRSGR
ncbi:MAG: type II secretion system GspH family protein [Defluviitaleaceae bacterium]|nr:type II secretion system GspH family protein [Defluviitaleaceae bacterium]